MFCSTACKKEAATEPRETTKRWCPTCGNFFITDMTDRLGAAPTYCSDVCAEKQKSLRRFVSNYTCMLSGCREPVPHSRWFCTEDHRDQYMDTHPDRDGTCAQCGEPTPMPDTPSLPPKFCKAECRAEYIGISDYHATQNAIRERALDNRQRTQRFAKEGKKGRRSTKPHDYTMAMSHVEKLRWGLYPERLLIQILKLGWTDEAEFFNTEDRWPPAVYEKIREVPLDARAPVGATIGVRDYGETEPRPMPPDTAAPSEAEYRKRARDIINAYESETETPEYVQNYILSTGHNPERR